MSNLKESLIVSFSRDTVAVSGTNPYELIFPVVTPFTLVSGLTGSQGWFTGTAPSTGSISWSIREEITVAGQIGTINIAQTTGAVTFTFSTTRNIDIGDVITIVPPAALDSAAGSLGVSIIGER